MPRFWAVFGAPCATDRFAPADRIAKRCKTYVNLTVNMRLFCRGCLSSCPRNSSKRSMFLKQIRGRSHDFETKYVSKSPEIAPLPSQIAPRLALLLTSLRHVWHFLVGRWLISQSNPSDFRWPRYKHGFLS